MSKCDLKITIDRPDRTYRPGDFITGAVEVVINEACECKDLSLALEWRTHGRGNVNRKEVRRISLFRGSWQPGEALLHEFRIEVPLDVTPSFHGTNINLDYYVMARADIPWAIDPKAETDVVVLGPETAPDPGPLQVIDHAPTPGSTVGCATCMGSFLGLAGLAAVIISLASMAEGASCGSMIGLAVGGLFTLIGPATIVSGIRKANAEKAAGPFTGGFNRTLHRAGDVVDFRVQLLPPRDHAVRLITARLLGSEKAVSGSGTNATTHRHEIFSKIVELCSERKLPGGAPTEFRASFPLPRNAPPTFSASSDNEITWLIEVKVQANGYADVTRPFTFKVVS